MESLAAFAWSLRPLLLSVVVWVASSPESLAAEVTRGPYLQLATPTGIVIRWRTDVPTNSRVSYGLSAGDLNLAADESASVTEHEVALTDLTPGMRYFYAVGSSAGILSGGADQTFVSTWPAGLNAPTRVWVLGDSGLGNANAEAVRDGFLTFNAGQPVHACLMLGDNAYDNGTDAEFQDAVFDTYPGVLRQTPLWPALGNHDTAGSTNPHGTLPYFQIFTLPTAAEAGGAPSSTEKYYSFDSGDVHFVCLDSQSSSRDPGSAMLDWLEADLAATSRRWIVVYFHHPVYSKGAGDTDTAGVSIDLRENVVPLLEARGVDLVLFGHSHVYERSYLIDSHYGTAATFTSAMKLDGGDGNPASDGAYAKPVGAVPHAGAVFMVLGTSASLHSWAGGSTAEVNPNPHPAMAVSLRRLGSVVLDVQGHHLDGRFIDTDGAVRDAFRISKAPADYWRFAQFGSNARTPAIAGDAADPDGDGLTNLLERAFGTPPLSPTNSPASPGTAGNCLSLTFPRSPAATDLTLTVQVSDDLSTWRDGSTYSGTGTVPSNAFTTEVSRTTGDPETIVVRDNTPLTSTARRFMRVKVTSP